MPELLPWHHMSPQDVLLALRSTKDGLKPEDAKKRLQEHGENRLSEDRGTPLLKIFWRQLMNPLVFVLAVAVGLSLGLGHVTDGLLTLAVMLMNVMLGVVQEYRAERALQALKKFLPAEVSVRREGRVLTLSITEVVPGDVLLLLAGAQVPADARVLLAMDVSVNESSLTGESAEVEKNAPGVGASALITEQTSMVFAGSTLLSGKLEAVVVATGKQTEFGRLAESVASIQDEPTPLQVELARLARSLVWVMVLASVLVFVVGWWRGLPVVDLLGTAAALAVASVPEGLLVSVTVILTVGMRRMLKRKALVRRLLAAETLGSVNVLCVDKTGTLTTGVMELVELHGGTKRIALESLHADDVSLLRDLRLVNVARVEDRLNQEPLITGSATEISLMRWSLKHKDLTPSDSPLSNGENVWATHEVVDELPFKSENKFSATLVREAGQERALVIGAPDVLWAKCDLSDAEARAYHAAHADMTKRGLRVLLLATKTLAPDSRLSVGELIDLKPEGLIGLSDPVRPNAKETLAEAMTAGVRIIMITGDHPTTAAAVAQELGLAATPETTLMGSELTVLTDAELMAKLRTVVVCARILPEQKLRIVKGLQTLGLTVAMTGDGVNDTPALRAADIGVAVGSGTEAAKEASDMVILDNDVRTIVAAIREGRIIFDNIRKVLTHLLTFSMSELGLIAVIILLGLSVPFWPLHILWINLVTDGLPSLALAFEPGENGTMLEPPRSKFAPLLTAQMRRMMMFIGLMTVSSLLILFFSFHENGMSTATLRTLLFVSIGVDSLLAVLPLRTLRRSFWHVKFFHNPQLLASLLFGFSMLFLPIFQPALRNIFDLALLTTVEWLLIVSLALVKITVIELAKFWFLTDIRKENQMLVS